MSVVTFYGSNKIETAQTTSMAGIATHLSIEKNYNTLLLNTKYNDTSLQECFWDQSMSIKPKSDLETGIGGLIKAIASNKTSPEIITNYTRTILKGRLELLTDYNMPIEDYDKQKEYMMLGLRKLDGISINKFKEKFGENPIYLFRKELQKLVEEELLEIDLDTIKLTNKGLDFANIVWEEFV